MGYDFQKAGMGKRLCAWLLDGVFVIVLVAAIASLLASAMGFDEYSTQVNDAYGRYEAEYGVSFDASQEEYLTWTEEEQQAFDKAYQALIDDQEAMYAYNMMVSLSMAIAGISVFVAVMGVEFVVPVLFKEGRTLGKRLFGVCVIGAGGRKITTLQLLVRALLGKFAVGTMIPVFLVLMVFWGIMGLGGILIMLVLLLAQLVIPFASRRNAALHDLFAGTVVADHASLKE